MTQVLDVPLEFEDPAENAKSVKAYFSSLKESWTVISWVLQELRTPQTIKWTRWMLFYQGLAAIVETSLPALMMLLISMLPGKDEVVIVSLFLAYYALGKPVKSLLTEARRVAREKLLGLTLGRLDHRMVTLFLEKSVGQHQQEGSKLSVANIDKGRMRTINIFNVVVFELTPVLALLVTALVFLTILSPWIGFVMLMSFGVHLTFSVFMNNWIRGVADRLDAAWRARNRVLFDKLKNVERVKTTGVEEEEIVRLHEWYNKIIGSDYALWRTFIRFLRRRENITDVGQAIAMGLGIYFVYIGEWQLAMLFPLYMWIESVADHFWRISDIEQQINYNLPAVKSMMKVLSIPPDIIDCENAVDLPRGPVGIEFRNVSYMYEAPKDPTGNEQTDKSVVSTKKHVLRNLSFTIKPGSKTAIVGPSGAGKTSIMRLLLRNMDPSSGQILVNGVPLTHVKRKSWLGAVGYVPQREQIFDATLRSNLLYGLEQHGKSLTDEELWQIVRPLQVDFGLRMTKGFDLQLGDRGQKVSGGQAQRIAIASAVIRNPDVLIMDEPTSSLDSTTEKKVQGGIETLLRPELTALIISHRFSTIRFADQIIVLRSSDNIPDGESQIEVIAASPREAYERSETFRQLADDQGYIPMGKAA